MVIHKKHTRLNRLAKSEPAEASIKGLVSDAIYIFLGVVLSTIGLKGFLIPNGFLDGGVIGISLLGSVVSGINLSVLLVAINIPFVIMGYKQISYNFAIKSLISIIALAFALEYWEFRTVTEDKFLIAIFGGFALGCGLGFSIRGGCAIDGTEVLAIFFNKRSALSVSDIMLIINVLLFSVAAFFTSIEIAMYAILTYFAASKTMDFVIHGIEEYTALTIVSPHFEEIKEMIIRKFGVNFTVFNGKSGFSTNIAQHDEIEIVYVVITRLQKFRLKSEIHKIDPHAFIVQGAVEDIKGAI
jgi:uncharacterized membrane-anchored protein YitT (DUF2179 family)